MSFHLHFEWTQAANTGRFRTGVSLHSHTLHSRESLDFIYRAAVHVPLLAAAIRRGERRYRELHGTPLDLSRGWWTPPLGPYDAWMVEKSQIENLDLNALVSLTDHDNMDAPFLLQLFDECREAPLSVEWTVPFRSTFFHLGIHNLPRANARALEAEMDRFRQRPDEWRLPSILAKIADSPEALVVLNHPLWDEKGIGQAKHDAIAREFLGGFRDSVHALELNGLRPWRENRNVLALASAAGKPAISGGDRHALEPNALVNLTNAASFAEFAAEVRSGWSEVLVLRQYREPYAFRILHNMMDVLKTCERHAQGWRLWRDRVFYACDDGQVRSLSELFGAKAPAAVALFVGSIQLVSSPRVRRVLRGAFPGTAEVTL
jgi:hypothetical protein